MRVLIVEDEMKMAGLLRRGLRNEGFAIDLADRGEDAIWMAEATDYDAIVLDVMLPGIDGFEVIRRLRAEGVRSPVLMLTARDAVRDRVAGLDGGADDYLTKPFSYAELLARLRAVLRRAGDADAEPILTIGELELDLAGHSVTRGGEPVHLTPLEFDLLRVLAQNRGRLVTHAQLLREVWGPAYQTETHYLRVHMTHIRAKIEVDPSHPQYLITEPGVGYRLRDDS